MPLPETKEELIKKLTAAYEKLDDEFEALKEEDSRRKEIEGGISACDVIAYQIGWGNCLLFWETSEKAGIKPEMPADGFKWNELGKLASSFYKTYESMSLKELRAKFEETVNNILGLIEGMTEKELFSIGHRKWAGEKWPIVKWIQVNTIAPYSSARTKIRRWKREKT